MLVLSRKLGEKIRIGEDITITVVETRGNRVRFSIEAPNSCRIMRGELTERSAALSDSPLVSKAAAI